MSPRRLCAISVDLDEIRHYFAIHGLPAPAGAAASAVYDRALARFDELAAAERVALTYFVVGSDLDRAVNVERLRRSAARGHELGNHTFDHYYDLSRRSPAEMEQQIERANVAIAAAIGARPTGFRAPGYVVNDAVYAALERVGMAYSSSVFPCPYYYGAKAALILAKRLVGRRSSSIVSSPGVLAAPLAPYRVGEPYYRAGSGLLELPIQVTPRLRLPFFGTALTGLGPPLARRLARSLVGLELVNLELHGIDLLDVDDGLGALAPHQPDVRLPLERKWATFVAVIAELRAAGYAFVRLDEAARALAAELPAARENGAARLNGGAAPARSSDRLRSPG
ncbi:MAG TPA: polysaccharide deacetylase family protein [Polyangiaceae bacterium]|nr:polysaccharide deacetylase family protein [Polyangiaceae bacterium]